MMKNSPLSFLIALVLSVLTIAPGQAQQFIVAYLETPGNADELSEACSGPYELVIVRTDSFDDTITITYSSSGEATLGVDYNFPAGTFPLVILPGEDSIVIPVSVINDGVPEGVLNFGEEIIFEFTSTNGTSTGTFVLLDHAIVDTYLVNLNLSGDTVTTCESGIRTDLVGPGFTWESAGSAFFNPAFVTEPGWYYLQVGTDACGAKDSVYIDVFYGNINEDTLFICDDGTGTTILTTIFGDPISFQWIPSDSTLSNANTLTPVATPTITTTYILEVVFAECMSHDTVVVRVDSLPDDLHINIAPQKPYYCSGEIVALFSSSFDSLAYPDLEFLWRPNDGTFLSDTSLLNAALQLQDTTLYIRTNTNNACVSEDSIMIDVVPSGVPLTVTDTTLCPGATFDVAVLSNQVTEPEWTPAEGLSCTMCLSPTVTVIGTPGTTQVYMFSGKIKECPVGATLTVNIPPIQEIIIGGATSICEDEAITLTILNPANLTSISWDIASGGANLSCNDCISPVVTGTDLPVVLTVSASTSDSAFCGAFGTITITGGNSEQFVGPTLFLCDETSGPIGPVNPAYTNLEWSVLDPGTIDLSCSDCPNPIVTLHENGTVILRADYHSGDTCSVIIRFPVSAFPGDGANIVQTEPVPDSLGVPQGSEVTVSLNVNGAPPTNIVWMVNGVTVPGNGTTLSFNANEEVNTVKATFTNSNGCEQMATLDINTTPPSFMIPNAFTPNNDGKNDRFRVIINGDITVQTFMVFNRWGQLVYEGPENDLEGWDGNFKGEPASSDTYVYMAKIQLPDRVEIVEGDVMLLR
jgi:gliding motility-associated-like protein